jgi:predicted DNA-binding WGR domain protein
MSKRRFEFVEGTSSKFWEVWIVGNEVRTAYGKIGTSGQTTIKDEGSAEAATKLYEKLVKEKTKKGYAEVGGAPASAPAKVEAAPKAAPKAAAKKPFELFARLTELSEVDAVDADGDDIVALADLEVLVTQEQRDNETDTDLFDDVKSAPKGSLIPLILHGSGSLVLGWKPDASAPMRAVWVDSEGDPRAVFAASMEEMFELVPHGLGYLYDCIKSAERGKAHTKKSDCDVDAWTSAGFAPHASPGAAVLAAYKGAPNFAAWLESLGDGDDDEEGEGGWQRFEMDEKFWAIKREGASHTVRYGKIGTSGQEKTKDFDDEAAAKKDHDKLVQEKTKKGYEPVDA